MRFRKFLAALLMFVALFCTSITAPASAATTPFPDIAVGTWYQEPVAKAKKLGLMDGCSDGLFHPTDPVTRAQFVQIIYNKYGNNAASTRSGFSDVPTDSWYAKAVTWASKSGIINGTGNKKFSPDNNLTREQLATILYAAAGRPDVDANRQLAKYIDYQDVSEWARDGMAWCVQSNIVKGVSENKLSPKGVTSRAEAAAFVVRYIDR